jgi:autotransporter adhesin
VGANAYVDGTGSIAVGTNANVLNAAAEADTTGTTAVNGIAIGTNASVTGSQASMALGYGATATGNNAIAIGANSVANRDNSVSVGSAGAERQITNVAAGTQATDAVNYSQLETAIAGAGGGTASPLAVTYDAADKGTLTLQGANGTVIQGVAAGVAGTDAVNMNQFNLLSHLENQDAQQIAVLNGQVAAGGAGMPSTIAVDGSSKASVTTGSNGVAVGNNATAGGTSGTAVGGNSFAAGPNDTALGGNAQVKADGSTAVGANTTIATAATNAVAVGESASVTTASGTAIGQAASVTAANAVALGQGSVASVANTVSVGSATNQRQITNVAAGVQATDAANVSQVNAALATAKTYTDASAQQTLQAANAYTNSVIGNQQSISNLQAQMNDQFSQVNQRLDRVGAMGAAMSQMTANTSGLAGDNRVGFGAGNYNGQGAFSVGYQRAFNSNRASVSIGASVSGSESSVGVGGGVSW